MPEHIENLARSLSHAKSEEIRARLSAALVAAGYIFNGSTLNGVTRVVP